MKYGEYRPSSRYASFIKMFWTLEGKAAYRHFSMADVCPELLFHFEGVFDEVLQNKNKEKTFTSGVHGQTSKPRMFSIDKPFGIFGISFYPQALPLLFGLPAFELTDEMPDLKTLLGSEGQEIEDKIFCAATNDTRIKIIESFVEKKLKKNFEDEPAVFYCIQNMIKNGTPNRMKVVARDCFLSERQFQRKFKAWAGLSPKLFQRIIRFSSATNQYGTAIKSLTHLALDSGYYDQSHFIHDFQKFSGLHPKEYFSGRSGATAWRD